MHTAACCLQTAQITSIGVHIDCTLLASDAAATNSHPWAGNKCSLMWLQHEPQTASRCLQACLQGMHPPFVLMSVLYLYTILSLLHRSPCLYTVNMRYIPCYHAKAFAATHAAVIDIYWVERDQPQRLSLKTPIKLLIVCSFASHLSISL